MVPAGLRLSLAPLFCLGIALGSAAPLVAQQPDTKLAAIPNTTAAHPDESLPTFKSNSRLVLVPVLVKGKNGQHVSGLERNAFTIEEQGKKRTVATFEEVKPLAPDEKFKPLPPLAGRSNFNFEDAPHGHMTILVLDMLNTPYLYQGNGKRKLIEMLSKAIPPHEATAVFALGLDGLRQLYEPTTNTDALIASLKGLPVPVTAGASTENASAVLTSAEFQNPVAEMGYQFAPSPHGVDLAGASWTTLTAMNQIAQAYRAVPGRKTLLWASGGIPGELPPGVSRATLVDKYNSTWRELNSSNIAVYSVDVSSIAGFNGSLIGYDDIRWKQLSLREFADNTGGLWCAGTAIDVSRCISRAFDDAGSYYLLGYYLPQEDQKPGWRKLKVKVAAPGAHVRARDGFFISPGPEEPADVRKRALLDALLSPVELTGVRMNVREVGKTAKDHRQEFVIGVLGDSIVVNEQRDNLVDLSVTAIAFGADGREHGHIDYAMKSKLPANTVAKFRQTGLSTEQAMDLGPGRYDIRFAVRDNLSGEIGTVHYPLEVK